ncbi:MAG: hypothetical protein FWC61_04805 [Proteobacteria bacterium]|nr:hypothetical protein [Pseudomonadota bacterium]
MEIKIVKVALNVIPGISAVRGTRIQEISGDPGDKNLRFMIYDLGFQI